LKDNRGFHFRYEGVMLISMKPSSALLLSAACVFLSSCATDQKLVGRIANIPADRRFVLVQRYGEWTSEAGTILTTRGPEGRLANLRVTGERLGEFAAADVQSGTVEKGDAVYSQHVPKPVQPTPAPEIPQEVPQEVPQPKDTPQEENIQKNN
jgi:hypothetical protein